MYTNDDYKRAIEFALNYCEVHQFIYDEEKDIFKVVCFDEGWYEISLKGSLIRNCIRWVRWMDKPKWVQDSENKNKIDITKNK